MTGKRAFIGPLGDDIPSIFPIILGVVIFLAAMMYAANFVDQRNSFLEVRKAAVNLAYSATEKGFYDSGQFAEKCSVLQEQAKAQGVFFVLTIKSYCSGFVDFSALSNDKCGGELLSVESPDPRNPGLKCWTGGMRVPPSGPQGTVPEVNLLSKDAVVLNYPMGVECKSNLPHRGLGMMNLVVWRQPPLATISPAEGC